MKKRFVVPALRAEAALATLTLTPGCSPSICDSDLISQ